MSEYEKRAEKKFVEAMQTMRAQDVPTTSVEGSFPQERENNPREPTLLDRMGNVEKEHNALLHRLDDALQGIYDRLSTLERKVG